MAKIILEFEGPDGVLAASLEALARSQGWTNESPLTQIEVARLSVRRFVMNNVQSYHENVAAKAAQEAAAAQTAGAIDMVTMTIEVAE